MFERIEISGSRPKSIALQTAEGTDIKNAQNADPDYSTERQFDLLLKRHNAWVEIRRPCGVYNCFGKVWASSRTSIYDTQEIDKILVEDGYEIRSAHEPPRVGDIVLYSMGKSGIHVHVGTIVRIDNLTAGSVSNKHGLVPTVLSKLSPVHGEVTHPIDDVHFPAEFETSHSIYTLRQPRRVRRSDENRT